MSIQSEMHQAKVLTMRKSALRLLHISGTLGSNAKMIQSYLNGEGYHATTSDIKNVLDYLEQRGVIKIVDRDKTTWAAKITPDGTDIMEGITKEPAWLGD